MTWDDIYKMWDLLEKIESGEELTPKELKFVLRKLLERFKDETLD
jgi:hypothetical protein